MEQWKNKRTVSNSAYQKVSDDICDSLQKHDIDLDGAITILLNMASDLCIAYDINPDIAAAFFSNLVKRPKKNMITKH